MIFACWALAHTSAFSQQGEGGDTPGQQATIPQLIRDLGAPEFATRELAQQRLIASRHAAFEEVERACRSPDPEIQRRATATLELLKEEIQRSDIEGLIAGREVQIPGWDRFRKLIGDGPEDRRLFAEMLQAEWEIVEISEKSPQQADYAIFLRAAELKYQIYAENQSLSIGNVMAMLFATSHPEIHLTGPANEELQYVLSAPTLSQSLVSHESSRSIRGVLNHWVLRSTENRNLSARVRHAILNLCLQENLESGVPLATSVLRASGTDFLDVDQNNYLVFGLLAIGKLGNKEHRPIIREYFDRHHRIVQYLPGNDHESYSTQLRDVALAVDIHLTGHDPRQFGFPQIDSDPTHLFVYRTIGFSSEAARDEAFLKWKEFDAAKGAGAKPPADKTDLNAN
ncbi:MAG: hypothetical protein WD045_02885 [Pirellulaceae bacterium]